MVFYVLEKNEAESNSVAVSALKGDPYFSKRKAKEISKISDYKNLETRVLKTFCLLSYFLICILSGGTIYKLSRSGRREWMENYSPLPPPTLQLAS